MTKYLKTKNLFPPPSSLLYTDLQVQFRTSLCAGGGKYIYDQGQNYRLSVQLNKVEEGFSKMHLKKIFPFQTCLLHFFLCITVKKTQECNNIHHMYSNHNRLKTVNISMQLKNYTALTIQKESTTSI